MAQCKQTAQEFIQSTFSPQVAVLCSADAELLCQKNNLTFVELIQPFCRLTTEAHIKDPNNVPHTMHNLKMTVKDLNTQPPQQAVSRKMLTDTVANAQPQLLEGNQRNVISIGDYDLQLSATTPWFEAYRECFLHLLPPSDHEFLNHCLACMFVVSSGHTEPLSMFNTLVQQQQQQHHQFPNKLPKWFCPSILKYYVLIHDVVEGEQAKAEAIYQSMKSTFGAQVCHLLQINSRSIQAADTLKNDSNMPDPWSQFLHRPPETNHKPQKATFRYFITWEGADYDVSINPHDDSQFPGHQSESSVSSEPTLADSVETAVEATEVSMVNSATSLEIFDHPLAEESKSLNGSLSIGDQLSPDGSGSAMAGLGTTSGGHFIISPTEKPKLDMHGLCLTMSDHDRLRIFMHEFSVRALIPWAERQMRILNDQLTSRKGIHRSIFSATRKIFGGKPSGQAAANQNTTVVYTLEAPELQMRRLADLAFLFQMYDFSYHTYQTAKRDFNNDHAWLHYAGALEMACISIFMQDNGRQYPHHNMDSAVTTYLATCRNPQMAARGTLISTEALKSKGMFGEAAMQFIKMTSEDSDLRSALLLEQAAHCFIKMRPSMARKYAFHMILAGHRFSKAGQKKHALRSYCQAFQVYKSKHWSLAEDHINFTIGRQSFNLKQLENATAAFKHLLTVDSKQTTVQQAAFLREYLFVYKQLLGQSLSEGTLYPGSLPELPLPTVDSNATKVLLCNTLQSKQEEKMSIVGIQFDQGGQDIPKWQKLEELLVLSANAGVIPPGFRPTLQCFTDRTDNKFNPVGFVGEPVTLEIYLVNPLKVPLVMTEVMILWNFLPHLTGQDRSPLISNEVITVKNKLADEIIYTQVVKELSLSGNQGMPVHLLLTPHQTGELRFVGLAYNLGTCSPNQSGLIAGENNVARSSYVSTISVRGKQRLEVQGPRLNSTKEEKVNKVYGPDRRLDLFIHPQMPLLQINFCNFPQTMLCGAVHSVAMEFTNLGSIPLKTLKLTSSDPKFFTTGSPGEPTDFDCVYRTRSIDLDFDYTVVLGTEPDGAAVHGKIVIDIPLPDGTLKPQTSICVPMWIRGHDAAGVHEVDFVFYYEPVEQVNKIRHRILRHTAVINTLESLSVQAMAERSSIYLQKSNEGNECLITCELENLSQTQSSKPYHLQSMQVIQVSCASKDWTIHYLSTPKDTEIKIGSREMMQICFKAVENRPSYEKSFHQSPAHEDEMLFSDVNFDMQQIDSARTPCCDFFFKSLLANPPSELSYSTLGTRPQGPDFSDLDTAIKVKLTLIVLWQGFIINEHGEAHRVVGQHHATITRLSAVATSSPYSANPCEQPPLQLIRDTDVPPEPKPSMEVSTQLVQYNFYHTAQVEHRFSKKCMCLLPVTLALFNCSNVPVHVLVDTSKSTERLNSDHNYLSRVTPPPHLSLYQQPQSSVFTWIGQSLLETNIGPKDLREIKLSACFSRPGVYNVNQLAVFVSYTHDSPEMILQKQPSPSVVIVSDAS